MRVPVNRGVNEGWWRTGREVNTVSEEGSSGDEEEVKEDDTDDGGLEKLQSSGVHTCYFLASLCHHLLAFDQ